MGSPLEEANMSVLAHGKNTAAASSLAATAGFLRKTIRSGTRLLVHAIDAIAEARMHKAEPRAELYRSRYRHSSKNDDDLPIVR
jgi:hypothetical protein